MPTSFTIFCYFTIDFGYGSYKRVIIVINLSEISFLPGVMHAKTESIC